MDTLVSFLVCWIWQVTIVAMFAALITRWLGRKRPRIAYVIWMIVIIKCLTPPFWYSKTSVFCWGGVSFATSSTSVDQSNAVPLLPEEEQIDIHSLYMLDGPPVWLEDAQVFGEIGFSKDADLIFSQEKTRSTISSDEDNSGYHSRGDSRRTGGVFGLVLPLHVPPGVLWSLLIVWGTGCSVLAAVALMRRVQFQRDCCVPGVSAHNLIYPLIEQAADRLEIGRSIRLLVSNNGIGPVVYGIFRPTIVIPNEFVVASSREDLITMVAHELVHVRRYDNLFAVFQLVAQMLWWFHPLIWIASRNLTRERERCCDDSVLAIFNFNRSQYAQNLINVLKSRRQRTALPALVNGMRADDVTLIRLETIMDCKRKRRRTTPASAWGVLILGIITLGPGKPTSLGFQHLTTSNQNSKQAKQDEKKAQSEKATSARKLQSIVFALHTYHDVVGHYPTTENGWGYDEDTKKWYRRRANLSWRVSLLPFIGEEKLFKEFRHDEPWDSKHNKALIERMPLVYRVAGSQAGKGYTSILGVTGENTAFHPTKGTYVGDFDDGTTKTIMLVEVPDDQAVAWTKPEDFKLPTTGSVSAKSLIGSGKQGFLACMADGSPNFILKDVPDDVLQNLFVRNDRKFISPDSPWIQSVKPERNRESQRPEKKK